MRFRRASGGAIELSQAALDAIDSQRQLDPLTPESGGILLGRLILDTEDVVVDEATLPNPADQRSRFGFLRRRRPAQRRVDEAWRASGGTMIYLGEWHTHPEDSPVPSCRDIRNWRKIMRAAKTEQSFLVFLIAGRVQVEMWEMRHGSQSPRRLELDDSN